MKLALENMTKSTELEDTFQDAAGNVLVGICKHSWRAVAQHLEAELLTGIFPHRSLLYVMGVLSSDKELFNKEDKASWEELLTQAFLFTYYGLILQAEGNGATVKTHLRALLETSHQWPKQREGIALTMGLAAVQHLDDVWAILEQFGRSAPIKWSLHSFSQKVRAGDLRDLAKGRGPQGPDTPYLPPTPRGQNLEDLRWKWASSTILLAYGQVASRARAHILPWVDNILSRMIFYFQYSSWDETLKQSFLTAILMLMAAISRGKGAHSYEFSQVPELLQCLMVLMEKEPQDTLCTQSRQQTLHIICSLCKLRPPLDLEKKSQLLSACFRSVFALPPLDALEKHSCLFLEPPNIEVRCLSSRALSSACCSRLGRAGCPAGSLPSPHTPGWGSVGSFLAALSTCVFAHL
uniref:Maestro heat-like repeat family member 5 n=1 Tax=Prolemur simus TaxID=1328070 RepID=A0A8C8YWW9_PROSS